MKESLIRAVCMGVIIMTLSQLPWTAVAAIMALILLWAVASNRTTPTRVRGSSVLVTGASSGLGKAIAIEAARRGASSVVLVARNEEKLTLTAAEITMVNPRCTPVVRTCDITDADACWDLRNTLVEQVGPPDILVNNAGAGAWHHIEEGEPQHAVDHMACPYFGAVYLTKAFFEDFSSRKSGHILNVTSAASLAGFRGANTYGAARWAMRGMSQFLRADLADLGIGVTLLNASEISGTSYFDNAPGKAGADSHDRIPWLFQLPILTWFNGTTQSTARAALNGVEGGTAEVLYPQVLVAPFKLFGDLFPELLHHCLRLGPKGRR